MIWNQRPFGEQIVSEYGSVQKDKIPCLNKSKMRFKAVYNIAIWH